MVEARQQASQAKHSPTRFLELPQDIHDTQGRGAAHDSSLSRASGTSNASARGHGDSTPEQVRLARGAGGEDGGGEWL